MPGHERVIVLKLGGSVLRSAGSLRLAVHEIYRWRRAGHPVVAVVSALGGETDELLRESRRACAHPAPGSVAAAVALGELKSASLLGLHLDRAGVSASVLSPAGVGFIAQGDPLDADPVALDGPRLARALERDGAVVLPGYVACDRDGRTVVLGRGGSDLTALVVASSLPGARCRLVKDVDGLYERDPAGAIPRPRRYARATWEDALAAAGSIVQHKALLFARARGLAFELGRLNGARPTRIGARSTRWSDAQDRPARLCVALLGLGTVGGGVHELLRDVEELEVVRIAVRGRAAGRGVDPSLVTREVLDAARSGADVVVELIGGLEPARAAVAAALSAGAHVVTANKRLLAAHGAHLRSLAQRCGRSLLCSAAVGGSAPLLERVRARPPEAVRRVRGVLNGTTNFVLERIAAGVGLHAAVREARERGFAESDPALDLSGEDAADKLCLIASEMGLVSIGPSSVRREALCERSALRARGRAGLRHVACLERTAGGARARVALEETAEDDPLHRVAAEHSAAVIELSDGTREVVRGKGAGRWPTAEAVVADLLELARGSPRAPAHGMSTGTITARMNGMRAE